MIINYNKEQLSIIAKDISEITGISISILDTEFTPLTSHIPKGNYCSVLQGIDSEMENCKACDNKILQRCSITKKLERHICNAGLCDSAMPIIKYDTIVGYVLIGQIRSEGSPELPQKIPVTSPDLQKELNRLYLKTPFLSKGQLLGLYDLMPRIMFNDAIEILYDSFAEGVVKYLDENLNRKITVNEICKHFHVSKNYLYDTFQKNLGTTITEYINKQKILRAKELLKTSNYTVYEVARRVGIDNYTYFFKLFKKLCKVTPTEYKKSPST